MTTRTQEVLSAICGIPTRSFTLVQDITGSVLSTYKTAGLTVLNDVVLMFIMLLELTGPFRHNLFFVCSKVGIIVLFILGTTYVAFSVHCATATANRGIKELFYSPMVDLETFILNEADQSLLNVFSRIHSELSGVVTLIKWQELAAKIHQYMSNIHVVNGWMSVAFFLNAMITLVFVVVKHAK